MLKVLITAVQHMFGPMTRREDGTYVFAAPVNKESRVPMVALADIGYFARYTFDHRELTSAKDLVITSEMVGWEHLVETFRAVTGKKAVFIEQTMDEWFANFQNVDLPCATERAPGEGLTWRQNFTGWWSVLRDNLARRDMEWIKKVHPNVYTLERWMRENNYTGDGPPTALLKDADVWRMHPNLEHIAATLNKAP